MKTVAVFDGDCRLCRAKVAWLERLDWCHRFEMIPFQDPTLPMRFPALDAKTCQDALHVCLPDGRIERGGDAIREILLRLPLTALPALLLWIPPLAYLLRRLYPLIARNRYAL